MTIGENIRRIRKEKGLTQQELANRLEISQQMIGQFENSKKPPKLETVEKIASALEVSAFDLMGFDYFDQKHPDLGKEVQEYESLITYLNGLGYSVNLVPEQGTPEDGVTAVSYDIEGNGISVNLSEEQFTRLQTSSADLIYSFFWGIQHKKK